MDLDQLAAEAAADADMDRITYPILTVFADALAEHEYDDSGQASYLEQQTVLIHGVCCDLRYDVATDLTPSQRALALYAMDDADRESGDNLTVALACLWSFVSTGVIGHAEWALREELKSFETERAEDMAEAFFEWQPLPEVVPIPEPLDTADALWHRVSSAALAVVIELKIKPGWGVPIGMHDTTNLVFVDGHGGSVLFSHVEVIDSLKQMLAGRDKDEIWMVTDIKSLDALPVAYAWEPEGL